MDAGTTPPRRYSDEEMSRLLRRAAELQRSAAAGSGLTLAELEEVAREAGIDVGALREAAGEFDRPLPWLPRITGARVAGAPVSIRLERTLSHEIPVEALEAFIPVVQSASDAPGRADLAGRTLAWRAESMHGTAGVNILVSVRDRETRIRVEERYGGLAAAVFGAGVGGIGSGVGFGVGVPVGVAAGSAIMAIGFLVAALGGSYLASRALFGGIVARRATTLETLLDTLSEELGASASAASGAPE